MKNQNRESERESRGFWRTARPPRRGRIDSLGCAPSGSASSTVVACGLQARTPACDPQSLQKKRSSRNADGGLEGISGFGDLSTAAPDRAKLKLRTNAVLS